MFLPGSYAGDLESRQWSHLPMGANFGGVAYAYTTADVFLDPVLLIENGEMELRTLAVKYIRTFELFNKSMRVDVTQLYHNGEWKGLLDGTPASITREGLSDLFVRFSMNLYGAPPLRGKEFGQYRSKQSRETIFGVGLAIRIPTGEYMNDKLINLGKNRFAIRPQIGSTNNIGNWTLETTTQVAFYSDNVDFYNGKKLEQAHLFIAHGNLIYNFKHGLWAALSAGFDYGGEITINGVEKNDRIYDIAWALSFAYPINRHFGLKFVYIGSRTQESTGLDTNTISTALTGFW